MAQYIDDRINHWK